MKRGMYCLRAAMTPQDKEYLLDWLEERRTELLSQLERRPAADVAAIARLQGGIGELRRLEGALQGELEAKVVADGAYL